MRVSRLRTEVGDLEVFLQGAGGAENLAVDGADGVLVERAAVDTGKLGDDLLLAGRDVDFAAGGVFDFADLAGQVHAPVETLDDLAVNGVDLFTKVVQVHVRERLSKVSFVNSIHPVVGSLFVMGQRDNQNLAG